MEPALRPATPDDLETFVQHRVAMFQDMDYGDEAGRARMAELFRARLRDWMMTGQVRGWVVEAEGRILAGALLELKEALPNPLSPINLRGYLFNVYTVPGARGQGLARRLTEAALAHAREIGLEIVELHASKEAEALYRNMGFLPTSEYRLILSEAITPPAQWKERR